MTSERPWPHAPRMQNPRALQAPPRPHARRVQKCSGRRDAPPQSSIVANNDHLTLSSSASSAHKPSLSERSFAASGAQLVARLVSLPSPTGPRGAPASRKLIHGGDLLLLGALYSGARGR